MGSQRRTVMRRLSSALGFVLLTAPVVAYASPPGNDNFASRQTVGSLPYQDSRSTLEATVEPGEPQPSCGVGNTVWYEYTPPSDTVLGANTFGSDFDTVIAVYTGTGLNDLSEVGCSDDVEFSVESAFVFPAAGMTTYHFQVGGCCGESGDLVFRIRTVQAAPISGVVTEEGTGAPLPEACVSALDLDFGWEYFADSTDAGGTYGIWVRQGSYLVHFSDCGFPGDHRPEWYDNSPTVAEADAVEVTVPGGVTGIDAALTRTCPGHGFDPRPQFIGTAGPDSFTGGPAGEIFCGFEGADRISGEGGRDTILGGGGPDSLAGGDGRDSLLGQTGNDKLRGGPKRDFCNGGRGRDRARGCETERGIP